MTTDIAVIDYGLGNLHSVINALRQVGAKPVVVDSGAALAKAGRAILPGVGAFADGMRGLSERGHLEAIRDHAAAGRPLLGICLGMQLLFERGEEFGNHQGLGLIRGDVVPIPREGVKVPHVGWRRLNESGAVGWHDSPLAGMIPGQTWAYFVHSFVARPRPEELLAVADYGPHRLCAAVRCGDLIGFQFHPEKSGQAGLEMLRRFVYE